MYAGMREDFRILLSWSYDLLTTLFLSLFETGCFSEVILCFLGSWSISSRLDLFRLIPSSSRINNMLLILRDGKFSPRPFTLTATLSCFRQPSAFQLFQFLLECCNA